MERVSAWKRLAGTGKGALGGLDYGAALGMPRSHGTARGREGIILSWGVLNNSTGLCREQDLGARADGFLGMALDAWHVPPGTAGRGPTSIAPNWGFGSERPTPTTC